MLVTGFPGGGVRHELLRRGHRPRRAVRGDRSRHRGRSTSSTSVLAEHRLRPAAVLLTHGHLDHTFSVAPVCGARGITAYVHPGDLEMLADPAKGLSADLDRAVRRPADLHRAGRRRRTRRWPGDRDRRLGDHRQPRARPYQRVGDVPRARRAVERWRAAVLHRRRAVRGLDRTHRPAGRRHGGDVGEPAGQGAPAARRDGRAARPRPDDDHRPRARHQPVPAGGGRAGGHRAKAGNVPTWQRRSRHCPASRSGCRRSA